MIALLLFGMLTLLCIASMPEQMARIAASLFGFLVLMGMVAFGGLFIWAILPV